MRTPPPLAHSAKVPSGGARLPAPRPRRRAREPLVVHWMRAAWACRPRMVLCPVRIESQARVPCPGPATSRSARRCLPPRRWAQGGASDEEIPAVGQSRGHESGAYWEARTALRSRRRQMIEQASSSRLWCRIPAACGAPHRTEEQGCVGDGRPPRCGRAFDSGISGLAISRTPSGTIQLHLPCARMTEPAADLPHRTRSYGRLPGSQGRRRPDASRPPGCCTRSSWRGEREFQEWEGRSRASRAASAIAVSDVRSGLRALMTRRPCSVTMRYRAKFPGSCLSEN